MSCTAEVVGKEKHEMVLTDVVGGVFIYKCKHCGKVMFTRDDTTGTSFIIKLTKVRELITLGFDAFLKKYPYISYKDCEATLHDIMYDVESCEEGSHEDKEI